MEPGDKIVRRSAYQTRQSVACEVRAVARVTPGGSLRLTSGALERAEYWRVATPAEVAAWDAHTAAQAVAGTVARHMMRCPPTAAGWVIELQARLEAAAGATAVALEACQPTKGA